MHEIFQKDRSINPRLTQDIGSSVLTGADYRPNSKHAQDGNVVDIGLRQ